MIQTNQITEEMTTRVLEEFDKSINNALETRLKTRYNFKGKLSVLECVDAALRTY